MAPQGEVDVQTIVPAWKEEILSSLTDHCLVAVDAPYKQFEQSFPAIVAGGDRTQNPFYSSGSSSELCSHMRSCFHSGFPAYKQYDSSLIASCSK